MTETMATEAELATAPPATAPKKNNQQGKKKKKNAPDRQQPAWLFPPDEENPVLNPKPETEEHKQQETDERLEAIKFLKHKAVRAPMKAQPPSQLLQLVAAFLASYGFTNSGRLFTLERQARKRVLAWDDQIGEKKFEKDMPSLVKIYKDWHDIWEARVKAESSSSEDESEDESVDSGVDEASDSDESSAESDDSDKPKKNKKQQQATKGKANAKAKPSKGSASSSSSDSDADDEDNVGSTGLSAPKATTKSTEKPTAKAAAKPTISGMINKLKRKADPSASSSDVSSSESEGPAKKAKGSGKKAQKDSKKGKVPSEGVPIRGEKTTKAAESSSSDSSDSELDESEASNAQATKDSASVLEAGRQLSSESSATLTTDAQNTPSALVNSNTSETSSSDSSDSDDKTNAKPTTTTVITKTTKRKRSKSPKETTVTVSMKVLKKNNAPFQRVAPDTKVDAKLASNAYVPYDYAERAHQDLVVTKGKGFTKEKNKKKRGSYRGGLIDTNGGKGIKFEE